MNEIEIAKELLEGVIDKTQSIVEECARIYEILSASEQKLNENQKELNYGQQYKAYVTENGVITE